MAKEYKNIKIGKDNYDIIESETHTEKGDVTFDDALTFILKRLGRK